MNLNVQLLCPLCRTPSPIFYFDTHSCPKCFLVFKSPSLFLTKDEESARYKTHQNANNDQGYIDFLNRLGNPLKGVIVRDDRLLDYGCGPYSQLAKNLEGYVKSTHVYDPLFFPDQEILEDQFDVVTCTEVVEHFQEVKKNWDQLVSCVKPKGILGIMTQFYADNISYKDWWYKNDPTHVVFYREKTIEYIAKKYKLNVLYNDHTSVTIFQNG